MSLLNYAVLLALIHRRICAAAADLFLQVVGLFFHKCHSLHHFVCIGQFARESCLLHIAIEARIAECEVLHSAVSATATRNCMLDVVFRIRPEDVFYSDLFAGVQTFLVLFVPEYIFVNICFGRVIDSLFFERSFGFGTLTFIEFVLPPYCSSHICIVKFAAELDMHLGVAVNHALVQQGVDHVTNTMQRAHCHRVAYRRYTRRAQAHTVLFVRSNMRICLEV